MKRDDIEDPERRFIRLLSRLQDLTLLILKGHLLIEEQLDYFLTKCPRTPSALKDGRFSYSQKLKIVRAFSGANGNEVDFAKAINKIRNDLAHHAELGDLPNRIDAMLRAHNPNVPRKLTRRQRASWLRSQVAFVCGVLRGYTEGFYAVNNHLRLRPSATGANADLAARS